MAKLFTLPNTAANAQRLARGRDMETEPGYFEPRKRKFSYDYDESDDAPIMFVASRSEGQQTDGAQI